MAGIFETQVAMLPIGKFGSKAIKAGAARMGKSAKNLAEAKAKKERGPVKSFFHITRNENVPNIDAEGLKANPPGQINQNSGDAPFKRYGYNGGGVWLTTEPHNFPVYNTSIGSNQHRREPALTTYQIFLPLKEYGQMPIVANPRLRSEHMTTLNDNPKLYRMDNTPPTIAFLNDIPPENLKKLGYLETNNSEKHQLHKESRGISPKDDPGERPLTITERREDVEFPDYDPSNIDNYPLDFHSINAFMPPYRLPIGSTVKDKLLHATSPTRLTKGSIYRAAKDTELLKANDFSLDDMIRHLPDVRAFRNMLKANILNLLREKKIPTIQIPSILDKKYKNYLQNHGIPDLDLDFRDIRKFVNSNFYET